MKKTVIDCSKPPGEQKVVVDMTPEEISKVQENWLRDAPDYKALRRAEYPQMGDQLDAIWKALDQLIDNGISLPVETVDMLDNKILAVKAKYPKPVDAPV